MKNFSFFSNICLVIILVVAFFLRFYDISNNPPSLNWDEVSLGYNAYSILKTGADEYGNKFPLSFRSFDDYKPSVYVYLTVPFIFLFGLSEFSVRFTSAIMGVLTVGATYFLVLELLSLPALKKEETVFSSKKTQQIVALTSSFFLAISPWHLQFSRAAYEGNIGISFFVFGTLFFLKGLRNKVFFIFSSISFGVSMYSYHSFRVLVPIFVLVLVALFFKELNKNRKYEVVFFSVLILFFIPFAQGFFQIGGAGSRLSMVTLFSDPKTLERSQKQLIIDQANNDILGQIFHNRRLVYLQKISSSYFDHYNPDFLFFHGDGGVQHHATDMGMLYLWDFPFLLFGLYAFARYRNKGIIVMFAWLFIAPLPASVTTGTPHPVRAIAMIPVLQIISAVGVIFACKFIKDMVSKKVYVMSLVTIVGLLLFNFLYYIHQYYVHTPSEYGYFWQYGNRQAIEKAQSLENSYEKIVMTYEYDQPYIYYLFYNKIDPVWYQNNWDYLGTGQMDRFERKIGKYEFRKINYEKDRNLKNTLLIGTPSEIPQEAKVIDEVFYLDGKIAYKIVPTDK